MEKIIALEELIEWSRIKIIHSHPWAWNKLYMKRLCFLLKESFMNGSLQKKKKKKAEKAPQNQTSHLDFTDS